MKERAGEKYEPSNGTEGMWFTEEFCEQCIHEKFCHTQNENDKTCDILTSAMVFSTKDPEYPREWIYDSLGHPTCTAHVSWDWGNDGDPDDPDNPKAPPPPPDPNQMDMFPLYPDEKDFEPRQVIAEEI